MPPLNITIEDLKQGLDKINISVLENKSLVEQYNK